MLRGGSEAKKDDSELTSLLYILIKIGVVWIYALFAQTRFYWQLATKDEVSGTFIAPGGFVISKFSKARTIKNATLICVIQPKHVVYIGKVTNFELDNVSVTVLVTRNRKC